MADSRQMDKWKQFSTNKENVGWWDDKKIDAKHQGMSLGDYLETVEFGDAGLNALEYGIYSLLLKRPGADGDPLEHRGGAPLKMISSPKPTLQRSGKRLGDS